MPVTVSQELRNALDARMDAQQRRIRYQRLLEHRQGLVQAAVRNLEQAMTDERLAEEEVARLTREQAEQAEGV